ncbi:MAG TPA: hypothetical protein VFS05_10250 [Gemmatimonadaceae bacterium]|nr:hypothetical protein [Gemmatimonadaceae bacterium]
MDWLLPLIWALGASLYVLGFALGARDGYLSVRDIALVVVGFALIAGSGLVGAGLLGPRYALGG